MCSTSGYCLCVPSITNRNKRSQQPLAFLQLQACAFYPDDLYSAPNLQDSPCPSFSGQLTFIPNLTSNHTLMMTCFWFAENSLGWGKDGVPGLSTVVVIYFLSCLKLNIGEKVCVFSLHILQQMPHLAPGRYKPMPPRIIIKTLQLSIAYPVQFSWREKVMYLVVFSHFILCMYGFTYSTP